MRPANWIFLVIALMPAALVAQDDQDALRVLPEVAKLRAETAAAEARAEILTTQIVAYQDTVKNAQAAAADSKATLMWALGIAGLVFVGSILQYVKVSREDRQSIAEEVKSKILPQASLKAAELVEEHVSAINSRIENSQATLESFVRKANDAEEELTRHLKRSYRSLAEFYANSSKGAYDTGNFLFAINYSFHALESAYRCGNDALIRNFTQLYYKYFTKGHAYYENNATMLSPNIEDIDALKYLSESVQDRDLQEGMRKYVAIIEKYIASGSAGAKLEYEPFDVPEE